MSAARKSEGMGPSVAASRVEAAAAKSPRRIGFRVEDVGVRVLGFWIQGFWI
jgi:hypothetical protein